MLRGIVSKYKKRNGKVLYPATIPHGDVIQEAIGIVLRGKRVCIEGRDCEREVKASTAFGLDRWTRRKGKSKGTIEREKGKVRKTRFNDDKGNDVGTR